MTRSAAGLERATGNWRTMWNPTLMLSSAGNEQVYLVTYPLFQIELGKQGLLTRLIRDSAGPCFNPVGILESRKQWVNVCCRDPQRELEDYMITDIDDVCWN